MEAETRYDHSSFGTGLKQSERRVHLHWVAVHKDFDVFEEAMAASKSSPQGVKHCKPLIGEPQRQG
jgi:hypothetical protein